MKELTKNMPIVASPADDKDGYRGIRQLIWLYFWLLIFEGALRKWILPGLSNQLLIVRDPVLLLCYAVALRKGAFPSRPFIFCILGLGLAAAFFSVFGLWTGSSRSTMVVLLYGLRSSFLHLPLIFLIAQVFSRRDVERVGSWLLALAVPMVILVFFQYRAGPEAWVNTGAGGLEGGGQIGVAVSGVDKIRPPGVFSYNTGLTAYLSLVGAYLLMHFLGGGKQYRRWLALAGTFALVASVPLAMSRSTLVSLVVVACAGFLCVIVRPEKLSRSLAAVLVPVLAVLVMGRMSFFGEGMEILGERMMGEQGGGIKVGIFDRAMDSFTKPVKIISEAPFFGAGLGVGSNVGAKLLRGQAGFILSEGGWERNVDEMGPLIGLLYIFLRIAIVGHMASVAWKALRRGSTLSFLLLSACGLPVLNGNFSQPTALGFSVLVAGLCLAAAKDLEVESVRTRDLDNLPVSPPRIRGRSAYAERLHGAGRTK
jgi:hypothetical protein